MDSTLASFPDPVFVLDHKGGIELTNPAAMELTNLLDLDHALPERLQELAHKALDSGDNYLPHSFKEVMSFRLCTAGKTSSCRAFWSCATKKTRSSAWQWCCKTLA